MIKIITHAGRAHKDEILAIAGIVIVENVSVDEVEIERVFEVDKNKHRDAYIVDVGREFDGDKLFDHHQGGPGMEGVSSFGLVVRSFSKLRALIGTPLLDRIDHDDCYGPQKTQEKFGITVKNNHFFNNAYEPLEEMMIINWMKGGEYQKSALRSAVEMLRYQIEKEEMKESISKRIEETCYFEEHEGIIVFMQPQQLCEDPVFGGIANGLTTKKALGGGAQLICGPGRESDSLALVRTVLGERAGLDFRKLKEVAGVYAIHNNGFFAVMPEKMNISEVIAAL